MYVWSSHIAEYGSAGQSCQSCSWSAEQGEMNIPLSPNALENLVSRDGFGRPVPRQPTHSPYTSRIWCSLTGFLLISARRPSTYLNRHTPASGQSQHQVNRVTTQLRSNGVHCRESPGTGPVVLNVLPVTVKCSMSSKCFSYTNTYCLKKDLNAF